MMRIGWADGPEKCHGMGAGKGYNVKATLSVFPRKAKEEKEI